MRAPPRARALAGIALMVIAPILRWWQGVPDVLYSGDMMTVGSAGDYVRGMFLSGFFPLVPWLGIMLAGTAAGDWLFPAVPAKKSTESVFYLSLFLIIAGTAVLLRGTAPEFFPPSLSFTFLVCGICLLAILPFPAVRFPQKSPLSSLGRISLTVFIAHHLAGYEAFRAAGLLHSLDIFAALALVMLSWALALVVAVAWSGKGFRYSIEWAIGLLERRASK
jgi:uncharacterized membrane protein YeiB